MSLGAEVGYKLEDQPNLGIFPLLAASIHGHEKVVRALLKAGAKPNQRGGPVLVVGSLCRGREQLPSHRVHLAGRGRGHQSGHL